eukprot:TRINITY_DN14152_c0_g1_i3.p2 TRINITY_DN14152_c0_g1~~TRINITY_DN14152_c0_g1_i3.p2  ORF type:complete len:167 (+),score=56.99 TRINITY_DN14152_c0_g1_i3:97-597(+)
MCIRDRSKDMAEHIDTPVFNAAFGGSCTHHVLPLAEQLCLKWKPAAVVWFCGTNDLQTGCTPKHAADNFGEFVALLPKGTPVVYLAATITPFVTEERGEQMVAKFKELKQLIVSAEHANVEVVDTDKVKFATDVGCYLGDHHHLNDEGHTELGKLLAPALKKALKK